MPHVDGGLTVKWNMLLICVRCHALAHVDTNMRNRLMIYMRRRYGILFAFQYPEMKANLRRHGDRCTLSEWRVANAKIKAWSEREWLELEYQYD